MAGAPQDSDSKFVDVNALKEIAKKDLVDALNSVGSVLNSRWFELIPHTQVNGAKTLVLDATLAGPLGLVTEVSLLKVPYLIKSEGS